LFIFEKERWAGREVRMGDSEGRVGFCEKLKSENNPNIYIKNPIIV
jgi:hypothetical protein